MYTGMGDRSGVTTPTRSSDAHGRYFITSSGMTTMGFAAQSLQSSDHTAVSLRDTVRSGTLGLTT
jgi:hypothetical protein